MPFTHPGFAKVRGDDSFEMHLFRFAQGQGERVLNVPGGGGHARAGRRALQTKQRSNIGVVLSCEMPF